MRRRRPPRPRITACIAAEENSLSASRGSALRWPAPIDPFHRPGIVDEGLAQAGFAQDCIRSMQSTERRKTAGPVFCVETNGANPRVRDPARRHRHLHILIPSTVARHRHQNARRLFLPQRKYPRDRPPNQGGQRRRCVRDQPGRRLPDRLRHRRRAGETRAQRRFAPSTAVPRGRTSQHTAQSSSAPQTGGALSPRL